jgi:hypothetical protein
MTSYRRARKRCRFTDRAKQRRRLSAGSGEKGPTESINLEIKDLESVTEQNPLDFFDVSSLNGRDLPTRPPDSGWFSDDLSFNSQTLLPRDGGSCRSDFGGSSCAVQPGSEVSAREVESVPREASGMPPARPERFNLGGRLLTPVCSCSGVPQRVVLRGNY